MASPDGRVAYSSLSKLEKGKPHLGYDDIDMNRRGGESTWSEPEPESGNTSGPLAEKFRNQEVSYDSYKFSYDDHELFDGGYESNDEARCVTRSNMTPDVNLKNVLSGIFSILTGRNKGIRVDENQQLPSSNVSFLGSGNDGDVFLDSSVYTPSAPPLFLPNGAEYSSYKEVLEAEPPEWLPDSSSTVCMQCNAPFTALTRGRHHCRFCGGIFCRICTKGRCLLPVRFRERNPQRVCDSCYDRLDPLQGVLINTISNAVQSAKHDVMDWTSARGWLNLPIGLSMEHEIYKASNTLRNYCQVC